VSRVHSLRDVESFSEALKLRVTHIHLERRRFGAAYYIDARNLHLDVTCDHVGEIACRLVADLYGFDTGSERHTWPATWWDAFKLRWFPRWALKRWPAQMKGVETMHGVVFPHLTRDSGPGFGTARHLAIAIFHQDERPCRD